MGPQEQLVGLKPSVIDQKVEALLDQYGAPILSMHALHRQEGVSRYRILTTPEGLGNIARERELKPRYGFEEGISFECARFFDLEEQANREHLLIDALDIVQDEYHITVGAPHS